MLTQRLQAAFANWVFGINIEFANLAH